MHWFARQSIQDQPEQCPVPAGSPLVATEAIATLRAVVRSFPQILAESWPRLLDLGASLVTALPAESSNHHSGIGRKPLQSGGVPQRTCL